MIHRYFELEMIQRFVVLFIKKLFDKHLGIFVEDVDISAFLGRKNVNIFYFSFLIFIFFYKSKNKWSTYGRNKLKSLSSFLCMG